MQAMGKWLSDIVGFLISSILAGWTVRRLPRSLVDNAVTGYIDSKIGALLGLTEAAADGFLTEWLIPILLGVLAVVVWHRFAAAQYGYAVGQSGDHPAASRVEYGLPSRIWIEKVEPSHVIVLGLLIAASGVAWLMLRTVPPDPKIAQLEAQVASLQRAQPTAVPAPVSPTAQPRPSAAREFTNRTVKELRALYDGRTAFQADKLMDPYKGMWIEVTGEIGGIYPDGQGGAAVISMINDGGPIECRFGKDAARRLGRYNNNENITVQGRISENQNGQQLYLLECEVK